jgi:hypothetical protein
MTGRNPVMEKQRSKESQHDQRSQPLAMAYESDALAHTFQDGLPRCGRHKFHLDHEQRQDHRDIGDPIQGEAPGGAQDRIGEPSERGAEHPRQVELNRVHGDCVGEVLAFHQRRQERGISWSAERLAAADDEGEREDHRNKGHPLQGVGYEQAGQSERAGHLDVLRIQQHLPAIHAIREDPAKEREQHNRELSEKEVQAQIKWVLGQIVDQPTLCELLDKGASRGNAGPDPHQPEITMAKRAKDATEKGRGDH